MNIDVHGATILFEIPIGVVSCFTLLILAGAIALAFTVASAAGSKGFRSKTAVLFGHSFGTVKLAVVPWVLAALVALVLGLATDWFSVTEVNIGSIPITTTLVVTWGVMLVLTLVCIWLTKDLKVRGISKRQAVAEYIVQTAENFVKSNMGESNMKYVPFIAALFSLSLFSSLSALIGLEPPTADISTELGWALVVFFLITSTKIKTNGPIGYVKSFGDPIFVMAPFNILGEVFTPISMSFRHFGNVLSGTVISTLLYAALAAASHWLVGLLPGVLGEVLGSIPFLDVGIPAVFSLYFDWFSSFMQAFIFCMLTMMYISDAGN